MQKITQTQRWFEIAAVTLTAIGKFVFMTWLDQKLAFTVAVTLFWLVYVIYRFRQNPNILNYWGFGKKGLKETLLPLGIAGGFTIVAFIIYAVLKGNFNFPWWHLAIILLLYPLWGTVQQFLTMSLVGGNLKDGKFGLSNGAVIFITAFLFGGIHYPNWYLIVATFLLALVYAFFFLKHRNLWPLGLFHGVLGTLFYFLVLGRDAFEEIFKVLG